MRNPHFKFDSPRDSSLLLLLPVELRAENFEIEIEFREGGNPYAYPLMACNSSGFYLHIPGTIKYFREGAVGSGPEKLADDR